MKKKYIITLLIFSVFFTFYKVFFEEIFFPPPAPILVIKKDSIKAGQNLTKLFFEYSLNNSEMNEIIKAFSSIYNTRNIKENSEYEIILSTSGEFYKFSFFPVPNEEYTVSVSSFGVQKYIAKINILPLKKEVITATGTITSSLYEGMINLGLSADLVIRYAEIFESKIDFFTETMPNDIFRLKVEAFYLNSKLVKYGKILSAEYYGRYSKENAIYYEYSNGLFDYFNIYGDSLKRAFLKAPLSYRRISAYFTNKRFHPILKYVRPHHGIDYAAPKGTPISTIGDGTIIFAGWNGGYGRMIKVRHFNGYESWYGHLSRYGKAARIGRKVNMGDVIGYVGSTGLSTGPHLHFQIQRGKTLLNFMKLNLPSRKSISKDKILLFKKYANDELDLLRGLKLEIKKI